MEKTVNGEASPSKRQKLHQGISVDDYHRLLHDTSEWYDGIGAIGMQKVLYRDLVTDVHTLDNATNTRDLLDNLQGSGNLSPTDISVLNETIHITKQFGFKPRCKNLLPLFQNVRNDETSKFTSYRKKLVKLGMALNQADVATLDGYFNTQRKKYEDSWHLIMDLEHRRVICEGKMTTFTNKLSELQLHSAKEALIEGNGETSPSEGQQLDQANRKALEVIQKKWEEDRKKQEDELKELSVKRKAPEVIQREEDRKKWEDKLKEWRANRKALEIIKKKSEEDRKKWEDKLKKLPDGESKWKLKCMKLMEERKEMKAWYPKFYEHLCKWYDERYKVTQLKVLYSDVLSPAELHLANKTSDLLDGLTDHGELNSSNPTILYDTIIATKQFGFVEKMTKIGVPINLKEHKITSFSSHRLQMMELGTLLTGPDVLKVDNVYKCASKNTDSWSFIMNLEKEGIIMEGKMDNFIVTLEKLDLKRAANALRKDISDASSHSRQGCGT